jgi:hypothetical protein
MRVVLDTNVLMSGIFFAGVAIVGSFRHQFVEFGNVLRGPRTALGNSPKSTLR